MKPVLRIFLFFSCIFSALAWAEDPRIEGYSAEGPFFDLYIGKDLTGYVRTRDPDCSTCPETTFKITSDVTAKLDGKIVPLKTFVLSRNQPAILHFDTKGKLKQIVWYSK